MDILWHGYSCFTLKTRHGTVVIDPYHSETGLTLPSLTADAVLVSHHHPEHDNIQAVHGNPRILDWPGEYEVKGMAITAQALPYQNGKLGEGVLFLIDVDNIKICFLSDMSGKIGNDLIESIGDIDILMIPVGGQHTLSANQAHEIIEELEPRAVIPMHYSFEGMQGELDGIESFLKIIGASTQEGKEKYTVNERNDLHEEKMEVILLKPQLG